MRGKAISKPVRLLVAYFILGAFGKLTVHDVLANVARLGNGKIHDQLADVVALIHVLRRGMQLEALKVVADPVLLLDLSIDTAQSHFSPLATHVATRFREAGSPRKAHSKSNLKTKDGALHGRAVCVCCHQVDNRTVIEWGNWADRVHLVDVMVAETVYWVA
jgi:hypothetical protein